MADNVSFQSSELATPASGTTISTDEAASGHIQRVKLTYSADGSDTHIAADADGLRVNTGAHLDDIVNAVATTDQAITTKSAVFGYTTSGGGSFEPVKVTPAGALTVEVSDGGGSITVDGSVSVAGTATVTGTVTPVKISGGTATLANVSDTASSTAILASNANRVGFAVFNDSTSALYLKFGTTASSTAFTVKLDAGAYYELAGNGVYTGPLDGVWVSDASGAARVTEW
jgi:hypothetical protein